MIRLIPQSHFKDDSHFLIYIRDGEGQERCPSHPYSPSLFILSLFLVPRRSGELSSSSISKRISSLHESMCLAHCEFQVNFVKENCEHRSLCPTHCATIHSQIGQMSDESDY